MGTRKSANQPKKQASSKRVIQRSRKGKSDRTAASRLTYQTGYKLPGSHRFLLTFADSVDTSEIRDASLKLSHLETEGLKAVTMCVLSRGDEPEDRVVHMEGSAENIENLSLEAAWSQLCDWAAVWTAARQQVLSLAQRFKDM